jgi:hypothetical protein
MLEAQARMTRIALPYRRSPAFIGGFKAFGFRKPGNP